MAQLVQLIRRYERRRRFWRKVEVRGREDCWQWSGGPGPGRGADVHAYELARGRLPAGARLVHRCGDTTCVNPDHMEIVDS